MGIFENKPELIEFGVPPGVRPAGMHEVAIAKADSVTLGNLISTGYDAEDASRPNVPGGGGFRSK